MDVVADRAAWTRKMIAGLRSLALSDKTAFLASSQTAAAAESYLRRALEALLDLGRHLLAKRFGIAATEYREIAVKLGEVSVLKSDESALMRDMAGYRNRMVHFYDEVTADELFDIAAGRLHEVEQVLDAIMAWINADTEHSNRS
jgi:uncharacterized protein YutE (UPF0331/DUF86 family)